MNRKRRRAPGVLVVTIGPPAAGKTAFADVMITMGGPRRRISRDILRAVFGVFGNRDANARRDEMIITVVQLIAVFRWLRAGLVTIVDDTCQLQRTMRHWRVLARITRSGMVIVDFRDAPRPLCTRRDAERDRTVGPMAIREVARRCRRVKLPSGKSIAVVPVDHPAGTLAAVLAADARVIEHRLCHAR